jgi:multicomponent Na+:H+ antiporter subunit B
MILISYGSVWTMKKIKEKHLSVFESVGAIVFIGTAFLGLLFGAIFFKNYLYDGGIIFGEIPVVGSTIANINTAGVIPIMNFAVGLKVIAGLFAIVLVMAYGISKKEGGKK